MQDRKIFTYKVREVYETEISIAAKSEADAMLVIDRINEDPNRERLLSRWLDKTFGGRTFELVGEHPIDDVQYYDFNASEVLADG